MRIELPGEQDFRNESFLEGGMAFASVAGKTVYHAGN
jgi:hypothetical protein